MATTSIASRRLSPESRETDHKVNGTLLLLTPNAGNVFFVQLLFLAVFTSRNWTWH